MPKLPSKVWNYFVNKPDNPKVTICQVSINNPLTSNNEKCNKEMAYSLGSTSAMSRHLKIIHNIHIDETSAQSSTDKQTSEQFHPKHSINSPSETLARCAVDGMSVGTILNSKILKDYLLKVHHSQMPKTENEIDEKIVECYNEIVEKYKQLFEYYKTKNGIFLITLEYVSMRRYSWEIKRSCRILAVHCNVDSKIESFVLAYSEGKLRVENVLQKFGLDLDSDIVGCTLSTQLSMSSIKVIHQVCVKSAIITTIQSIIYNNGIYQWAETLSVFFFNIKRLEILQKYVVVGKGEDLKCICVREDDWTTTKNMMERLILLQPYIKQAFESGELNFTEVDYKRENVYYDEHQFCDLKNIVECLKLLEKAIGELDESNSNLLTADETIKNVLVYLRQIESDFGKQLIDNLKEKYANVRNRNNISLMYFLKHRKYPMDRFECFEYSTKAEIVQTANDLNQRLFCKKNLNQSFDGDLTSHFELIETTTTLSLPLLRLNEVLLNIRPVVTFNGELDLSKFGLNDTKIINELVFLRTNFLNKVDILRNEKALPKSKLSSQVWHYFILKPDNAKVTICQITSSNVKCNKSMSYSSSSTSAMARHLKSQHNINIDLLKYKRDFSFLKFSKTPQSSTKEFNKLLSEISARCAADGMLISIITNSSVIKDYINKVHHIEMPNSENEIKELIYQFYNQAVDEYRNMFEHFKTKGVRFSLTSNYLGKSSSSDWRVNCYADSKIESFYLAKKTYELIDLDQTLRIFGLDMTSDIVACTWNYKYPKMFNKTIDQLSFIKALIDIAFINLKYADVSKWVKNLYFLFRSTHNSKVLQKYLADGEKIELIKRKSDWTLNAQRAERLFKLQPYIKEALESGLLKFDLHDTNGRVDYDEHKFGELKYLVDCLKPLEAAQSELDNPNLNLLTAEVVMKYVFVKLKQIDSDMSRELIDKLTVKYKEIRNQNIVSLMYFLKHRKYPIEGFESFEYSSKDEIIETANKLNQRLFPNKNPNKQTPSTNSSNLRNSSTLIDFINSEMCDTAQDVHLDGDLATHFDSAEKTKTLAPQLERLYNSLISIRPSVIDLDTKLTDWSYDQLKNEKELYNKINFLKHYFIRKDTNQSNQQKRPLEQ